MKSTTFLILIMFSAAATAQQAQKDVFADPQNLKVLPEDISSQELGDTMKGFAMGLGVRCETCHVGEPNTPLETFDFASDEKAMKRKARVMIAMVREINTAHVARLDEIEAAQRVEVRCVTCHRGRPQPKLIQDVLNEQLAEKGTDAAVAEYGKLRDAFHGSHSYDFSEFVLPMYAQELMARGDATAAAAFAEINVENFPNSYFSHFTLAEIHKAASRQDAALESYERAAELNPRARPFIDARIAELSAGTE